MDMYDRINILLKEKNMNKKQLAEKANIPYTTLASAFSRKSKSVSIQMITDIAKSLDVPIIKIIGNDAFGFKDNYAYYQEYSSLLNDKLGKLSIEESMAILSSLDITVEYILRSDEKMRKILCKNFGDLILYFGQMLLSSWEMRFSSIDNPLGYLKFLKDYGRCNDVLNSYKDSLIENVSNCTFNETAETNVRFQELLNKI